MVALIEAAKLLEAEKKREIAIPKITGLDAIQLQKIAEMALINTEIKCSIHVPKETQAPASPPAKSREKAILVSVQDASYKDVLSKIRGDLAGLDEKTLKRVGQAKDGQLKISVAGSTDCRPIEDLISRQIPETKVTVLGASPKKMLVLGGLDALSTREEIATAVREASGIRADQVEIINVRPAFGGTQAATIRMSADQANGMITRKLLRVGPLRCSIREWVTVQACHNCSAFNHVARNCPEAKMAARCYKCGKADHKWKDCQNSPLCLSCKTEGHRAHSRECPAFRRALDTARRNPRTAGQRGARQKTAPGGV